MKISELMERLGELQAEHGDLEVQIYDSDIDHIDISEVSHQINTSRALEFIYIC